MRKKFDGVFPVCKLQPNLMDPPSAIPLRGTPMLPLTYSTRVSPPPYRLGISKNPF